MTEERKEQEEQSASGQKAVIKHYRLADPYRIDNPEPGKVYAWVTTSDRIQYAAALNTGWEPVVADTHPDLIIGGYADPRDGFYHHRELVLCEIPANVMEERKAYHAQLVRNRTVQLAPESLKYRPHQHISQEMYNKPDEFVMS